MTRYLLAPLLVATIFAACGGDDAPPPTATSPAAIPTATDSTPAGTLSPVNGVQSRLYHTATVLPDGSVLLAGGSEGDGLVAAVEVLDPATLAVTATAGLIHPRQSHTATLLSSGHVLLAGGVAEGGISALVGEAELFDPASATLAATASLQVPRLGHHALALSGDRAIIAGGVGESIPAVREVEVYDLSLAGFEVLATLSDSFGAVVGLVDLGDGRVLIAGVTDAATLDLGTGELTMIAGAWPAASRVAGLASGAMLVVGACCDQPDVGVWVVDSSFARRWRRHGRNTPSAVVRTSTRSASTSAGTTSAGSTGRPRPRPTS